jgi:nucleotide-binding universal stress UspA family protein
MTRIICGLDDSDVAGRVAGTATWLARALAADVMAIHVRDQSAGCSPTARVPEGIRSQAAGADVRGEHGYPARRLAQIADAEEATLLVVGSRGRGALRSAALGSVSRELAVSAPCPVVIVPPGAPVPADPTPMSRCVVCGVDGSGHALAAVTVGVRLARALHCRPVIVHARRDFEDARRHAVAAIVDRAAAEAGGEAVAVIERGPPAKVLEDVAERERAVLLVVAARGLRPVRAALLGSTAARATATSRRAVVVLSERAEAAVRGASGSPGKTVAAPEVGA